MEVRYTTNQKGFSLLSTEELRENFLIETLFEKDKISMVYSDIDRSITGTAVPLNNTLKLAASKKEMAADYFTERREMGVINIGNTGTVLIDGTAYNLENKDGLYIGKGCKNIEFKSHNAENPALFYFVSYPAHTSYPDYFVPYNSATKRELGTVEDCNKRVINQYIHPGIMPTCQLVMGLTELEVGSVWNTMPAHTHLRRSEVYMYFNISPESFVVHLIGEPDNTRHIIIRDKQAVLSPSWSLHSGVGTKNYSFIWAMGGENQVFDDMDWIPMDKMK